MPAARLALTLEPLDLGALTQRGHRRGGRRRRGRDVSSGWCATTTSAGASDTWSTKRTSRWRCRPSSGSPARSTSAGRARGWRCTTGSAGSRSARPASRSSPRSPHRGDAFAACRYAIERVKQIAPIWKREFFDGGDVWIEGATADPGRRSGARGGGAHRMRVTVRLFARLRDIAGAAELARDVAPRRDDRRRLARSSPASIPALAPLRARRSRARSTPTTRGWTPRSATATKSRSCRRYRADE